MDLTGIVNYILDIIRSSGAWGVVLGVLVESVLAPIPSPIVIMGAGFILLPATSTFLQILSPLFFKIILPGAIATTVGSFIGYGIGYLGGKPLIQKLEWFLGVSWEELNKGIKYFQKGISDEVLIFGARALPVIPLSVFSAVAGALRIKVEKFTLFTFLGASVRILILGISGWVLGSAYEELATKINVWENIGLIVLFALMIIVFFLIYKRTKKNKKKK